MSLCANIRAQRKYHPSGLEEVYGPLILAPLPHKCLCSQRNDDCEVTFVKVLIKRLHMERCGASENEVLLCELQKSYENLLMKYAEAENTIDRMKLGYLRAYNCEDDDNGLKLKAVGYVNDCDTLITYHEEAYSRSTSDKLKGCTALITRGELGLHSTIPLDLFHDKEVSSSSESPSASCKEKPTKFSGTSIKSVEKGISSKQSEEITLNEGNQRISQSIGPRTGKLTSEKEENVGICSIENNVVECNFKSTDLALQDTQCTDRGVNLNAECSTLSNSERNLGISHLRNVISPKNERSQSSLNDGVREKNPSTYRYALVWPIQFETNIDLDARDGNGLQTCCDPCGDFSLDSSGSISSLEQTFSSAQTEEVSADAAPLSICNGVEASPSKEDCMRSDFLELHSKSHMFRELTSSIELADILASKMKKKSENLKLFLASQLKNVS